MDDTLMAELPSHIVLFPSSTLTAGQTTLAVVFRTWKTASKLDHQAKEAHMRLGAVLRLLHNRID